MVTSRWGITVPFDDLPLHQHAGVYGELAAAGYTDLWSVEAAGADGVTPLAIAAAVDPSLRLGTAIVSAYTRGPALLAQTAAAMADLVPGRFVFGIGASSDVIVRSWNGIDFAEPYKRVRDTLRFLRRAFSGEKITGGFETFDVNGFRLARVPAQPPRLLIAALREQMLRLGGREADGVILNLLSADDVTPIVRIVNDESDRPEIVARIMVCPTEDVEAVRAMMRPLITGYLSVPVYRRFQSWLGRGALLEPLWDAWDAGDRKGAVAAVADELVDAFCVHGTPEQCRAGVAAYVANGITTPVLAVLPIGTDTRSAALALGRR
jgi:probable F420-dependent oxidoreductase